jgi:hypothetical protein
MENECIPCVGGALPTKGGTPDVEGPLNFPIGAETLPEFPDPFPPTEPSGLVTQPETVMPSAATKSSGVVSKAAPFEKSAPAIGAASAFTLKNKIATEKNRERFEFKKEVMAAVVSFSG